jgi:hypothetical protein
MKTALVIIARLVILTGVIAFMWRSDPHTKSRDWYATVFGLLGAYLVTYGDVGKLRKARQVNPHDAALFKELLELMPR